MSAALACIAERATYSTLSTCSIEDQVYLLGENALYSIRLRTWQQRVDALIDENNYSAALRLATDLYTGKAVLSRAQRASAVNRQHAIAERIVALCVEAIDRAMTKTLPRSLEQHVLIEHYRETFPAVIDSLVTIQRVDVLYDEVNALKVIETEVLSRRSTQWSLAHAPPARCTWNVWNRTS